jgi:hypothetical protein
MVEGKLDTNSERVSIDNLQFFCGYFLTPNILLKLDYVNQYNSHFPTAFIFSSGHLNAFIFEGIVPF